MINIEKARKLWPTTCHGRWMSEECEPGLVSVIIPTYNRAGLVIEAMDSVFAQTYRPIELIVVDDGSTDNTADEIEKWRKAHSGDASFELRYLRQENRRVCAARNLGLIESRGEFIQYLDSDDIMLPEKLAKCVALMTEEFDYVYGLVGLLYPDGICRGSCGRPIKGEPVEIVMNHWQDSAPLYRRRLCLAVGPWDESVGCSVSLPQDARVKILGFKGLFIPEDLCLLRSHEGERMTSQSALSSARNSALVANKIGDMLDRFKIECSEADNILARYLLRAAVIINAKGDKAEARKCFCEAGNRGHGRFKFFASGLKAASFLIPGRVLNYIAHLPSNIREARKKRRAAKNAHVPAQVNAERAKTAEVE